MIKVFLSENLLIALTESPPPIHVYADELEIISVIF